MQPVRHLLAQSLVGALICAVALLLKLLVPGGYMIAGDRNTIIVSICSGTASTTMSIPAMGDDMASTPDRDPSKDHDRTDTPCPYAGLSTQVLGAVDPVVLAMALAFVAALAVSMASRPVLRPAPHLRPPLRGPPFART